MTRKHFTLIAETIRTMSLSGIDRAYVAITFADTLAGENPRFDRERFLAACGVAA